MNSLAPRHAAQIVACVLLLLVEAHPGSAAEHKEIAMQVAKGAFDVTITPESEPDKAEGSTLGRMRLEKRFQGNLEASSQGEMLTAMTDVKGSAAYVAIERVTGTLHGRRGSFALTHKGTMARGAQELTVEVVPDSGSGDLKGLSGSMKILIAEGKHSYELAYQLTP